MPNQRSIVMSETTEPVVKDVVSAGAPQRLQFGNGSSTVAPKEVEKTDNENGGEGGEAIKKTEEKPAINDEILKEYFKSQGIEFGGIDDLKAKLNPSIAPTPEQIKAKEEAIERRMLQIHLDGGGKVEDFASVKKMLTADIGEVSKGQLHHELISQGFDEEEAIAITKQMFLQEDLDTIEQEDEETDKEFESRKAKLEKKVKYGADKLANRSSHIKQAAEQVWNDLKSRVEQEDADEARETKFSATVDGYVKALPKTVTLSLGKVDDKDIEPIVYTVPEGVHQEISALLKDKAKRNEFFYDAEGNINLQTITDVLIRNKILEKAARETYLKGGTAQVKIYDEMFPARNPVEIGIGGAGANPKIGKGEAASAGKPQRVRPTYQ